MIESIAHPTDFSIASKTAFDHALRLALLYRCRLDLLHVRSPQNDEQWQQFPHVRETLVRWGLLPAVASVDDIHTHTGITVRKVEIRDSDAVDGIVQFILGHRPNLMVLATHGRTGLKRWLKGSISEDVASRTHVPVLFVGPDARPFVNSATGELNLHQILIPLAQTPPAHRALLVLESLLQPLQVERHLLHVGDDPPNLTGRDGAVVKPRLLQGPVVEALIGEAANVGADLIAMPTAGRHGFLDALRGSTTEQVLRMAPCPVLALPA